MRRGQDYTAVTEFDPVIMRRADTLTIDFKIDVNGDAIGHGLTVYGIEWRLITEPVPPASKKRRFRWRRRKATAEAELLASLILQKC